METKHYIVKNIAEFSNQSEAVKKLEEYLNYIEEIAFSVIEEVFGQTWDDGRINIELDNSIGGASYCRNGNLHIVRMGINNGNIQKEYPENLWGCLLHETLHAFMNPIIYRKEGYNELNGGIPKEVFTLFFQQLVYLKLKEKRILDEKLFDLFCQRLKREVGQGKDLYEIYEKMFLKEPFLFIGFIKLLNSSEKPLLKKETFYEDLKNIKKNLKIKI